MITNIVINAMQAIMLRGEMPSTLTWAILGGMAVVTFVSVSLVWNRQNNR